MTFTAARERLMAPGYGTCYRCGRPWKFVESHVTDYRGGEGCFPLCEGCWQALETPEARLPYYRMLFESWLGTLSDVPPELREESARNTLDSWPLIAAAVAAGG